MIGAKLTDCSEHKKSGVISPEFPSERGPTFSAETILETSVNFAPPSKIRNNIRGTVQTILETKADLIDETLNDNK